MLALALLLQVAPAAQQPAPLTVPYIMRGPENTGREPEQVRWSPDGQWIYFRWLPPGTDWREQPKPYRVRASGGAPPEAVSPMDADSMAPLLATGSDSRDRRWRAVAAQGDIWLVDRRAGRARRLTETRETESSPVFSRDERRVYFSRDGNLYSVGVADGATAQLTDFRRGPKPKEEEPPTGQRGFLQNENRALIGAIADRLRADSIAKAERTRRDSAWGYTVWLGADETVEQISPSPDGRFAVVVARTPAKSPRIADVPNYIAASGYTTDIPTRTNVGDAQSTARIGVVALPRGSVQWLRPIPGDTAGIPSTIGIRGWSPDGARVLLSVVTRNYKTRYLHTLAPTLTGTTLDPRLATIDSLTDSAWVGGPCGRCAGWLPSGLVWFVSEADGWAHLYLRTPEGGTGVQVTSGAWEVLDVDLSPDGTEFWLHSSEGSPYERHFWRLPTRDLLRIPYGVGTRTRVTTRSGGHNVTVAPDGRSFADVHSTADRPPELFVGQFRPNAPLTQLTTSPTAEWLARQWLRPEIVEIPASDGVGVPARIYRPEQVGARPNGAAVIFVHGAGYLHNVHNYWSSYFREYQFHHLLAQKGYLVLDLDYRGSAGYGRDWRTAIYRHMGGRDLQDHVDASRWLQREHRIDGEQIGIYGGSYGGFITLMALFTSAENFGAGAALRSVTDWAYYNHDYTGRILNLPHEDSVAYRRSSPIYFAEGLDDPLLIAHGMIDTNVHFQDVVRLSERLIELGKVDWEMAVYPAEDHGFVRPDSWTDEYRRILELFERSLARTR